MAVRNGVDVTRSEVEVVPDGHGSYNVQSVVTTLEYSGASRDFAEFLAEQLRDHGTIYPRPEQVTSEKPDQRVDVVLRHRR